ncbi:MAG: class I SAM-dependent methyltransferase [Armatimonadota bacterium]|nr:methyltransferase domain-containing protein [bacterium]MDW8320346.1 class I SAM-dependent methyltransferase [Armatimonadota bacterium]
MGSFEQYVERTHRMFLQIMDDSNRSRYDAELWKYCRGYTERKQIEKLVRFVHDLLRLASLDVTGKTVLDAGCGFGRVALVLAAMGAQKVYGVDITTRRLNTFQQIIRDLQLEQSLVAEYRSADDTCYPDEMFDLVLSIEAVSHYNDIDAFFREAARVLKPGGVLLISDGNNGRNPRIARFTRHVWNRFENGPPGEVHGHTVSQSYRQIRRNIIAEYFPALSGEEMDELARRTSYMNREQVIEAVQNYLATRQLPHSLYNPDRCPVDPRTGAVIERLFDPFELARYMQQFGFRAKAFAYFGGASGNPLLRVANSILQALSAVTMSLAPSFRIVAIKEQAS